MRAGGHYHYGIISHRAVQFLRTSVFDEFAGFCVVKTTKSEVGKPNFLGTRVLLAVLQ